MSTAQSTTEQQVAKPCVSIVVPSYNQAAFLPETLQSLVDQNLPGLEVIIQDDQSTDNSVEVAQGFVDRHPEIFSLFIAEKNGGHAATLNAGFARARGDILGYLNSDDTLYPGCLARVVKEIDPARGRFVVFGRCMFTGDGSRYVGVEHPAEYTSHFDMLAIWKRRYNTIPQPSVFWHRKVMKRCGNLDPSARHVLDYDLFCRFSRRFRFHKVDELWSTYRMHAESRSSQRTEDEILEMSIAISRRHWGSWLSPLRWRCEFSHWFHNQHLHEHARHHVRRAEEAGQAGRPVRAAMEFLKTLFYSPKMARDRLLFAWLSQSSLAVIKPLLGKDEGFTGHYGDLWIGPIYRVEIAVPADARRLVLHLKHIPQGTHKGVSCLLKINGNTVARHSPTAEEDFRLEAEVTTHRGRRCQLELRCSSFFVPRLVHGTPDDRQLSIQLLGTKIETA